LICSLSALNVMERFCQKKRRPASSPNS